MHAAWDSLPPIDKAVADYMNREHNRSKLADKFLISRSSDKECSVIIRQAYSAMGHAIKALNASCILQAATAKLLQAPGEEEKKETPPELKEFMAWHQETMLLNEASARETGRAMGLLAVLERTRILGRSGIKADTRNTVLNQPINPIGLFADALPLITSGFEEQRRETEALEASLPLFSSRKAPPPPPPPPPAVSLL